MSCKNVKLGTNLAELTPLQLRQVTRHVHRMWQLDLQSQRERRRFATGRRAQAGRLRR